MSRAVVRIISALTIVGLATACGEGLLDPRLGGRWGGENLQLDILPRQVTVALPCGGEGVFTGEVRLLANQHFAIDGRITSPFGGRTLRARLSGTFYSDTSIVSPGDSLVVRVTNLESPVDEPLPITVHRDVDGTFTLLCNAR